MEDNLQTIIIIIISTFLLFIFPVYMAYEKKDDISYALAMRYTQDFVNDVRSKGYITSVMYENYEEQLKTTGNTYDIELKHEYNRYDPITNYYNVVNGDYNLLKTSTIAEREAYENTLIQNAITTGSLNEDATKDEVKEYVDNEYRKNGIYKVEDTYMMSTETYTMAHILNVLNGEKKLLLNATSSEVDCSDGSTEGEYCQYAYIMNVGDGFNVIIKNTNTTLATVMYNLVTANTLDSNTRIYANYGGSILAAKWYGDIDYAQLKHDNLGLTAKTERVIFADERHFQIKNGLGNYPTEAIPLSDKDHSKYIIEFEAKPEDVTELREKSDIDLITYSGYNFALGTSSNKDNMLAVSVGTNGISLLVTNESLDTIRKTFVLPIETVTTVDAEGIEETIQVQRKISNYTKLYANYDSGTKQLRLQLFGNEGINDYYDVMPLTNKQGNLWKGFAKTINTPTIFNYDCGTYTDSSTGIKYKYNIQINESVVQLKVQRFEAKNQTILSYATKIDNYAKIKIEISEQDEKYIAELYVNDIKVGESIKMDTLPKADIVGKTVIGGEDEYFSGYIRNVKIYEMGD